MALGTVLTGIATAAGGTLLSKALGGGTEKATKAAKTAARPNFTGGGLTGKFSGGSFNVTSSAARDDIVGRISQSFTDRATQMRGLRDRVAPGMSDLRRVRLGEVENARTKTVSDLRENLQRRRVLGSSFAADAVARANLDFNQERDRISAESFMQGLQLTEAFLTQEFEATTSAFTTKLGEMNLQAEVASGLSQTASKLLSDASQLEMKLAASSSAGAGQFFNQALRPVFSGLGNWAADMWETAS